MMVKKARLFGDEVRYILLHPIFSWEDNMVVGVNAACTEKRTRSLR